MEYFLPIKKKEVTLLHIEMEQVFNLLSEKSEVQNIVYSIVYHHLGKNKSINYI